LLNLASRPSQSLSAKQERRRRNEKANQIHPVQGLPEPRQVQGDGQVHDEGRQEMSDGLYANIAAKKRRIKLGSDEKMRKPGSKGAPSAAAFKASAKTAKKK
jgi:hypothetical protein